MLRISKATFSAPAIIFYQIVRKILHLITILFITPLVPQIFIKLFTDLKKSRPVFSFYHIIYQTGTYKFTRHFRLKYSQSLLQEIFVQTPADLRYIAVFCPEQHFIIFVNILIYNVHLRNRLRIFEFFFQLLDPAHRTVKPIAAAHTDCQ